jgi:hypothetical protein
VVVAAASGPMGSLIGQLARLASARAVGIAGGAFPFTERRHLTLSNRQPEIGSRSSLRCMSRSTKAAPATWLVSIGAKKIFYGTAYP